MKKIKERVKQLTSCFISLSVSLTMLLGNICVLNTNTVYAAPGVAQISPYSTTISKEIKKIDAKVGGINSIMRTYEAPLSYEDCVDISSDTSELSIYIWPSVSVYDGSPLNVLNVYVQNDDDTQHSTIKFNKESQQLFSGEVYAGAPGGTKAGLSKLSSIILGEVDTSAIVDASAMFKNAESLVLLTGTNDKELFSSAVSSMKELRWANDMFDGCISLPSLDVSGIDLTKMKADKYYSGQKHMFNNLRSLEKLTVGIGWDFIAKTDLGYNSGTDLGYNWMVNNDSSVIVSASCLECNWTVPTDGYVEINRTASKPNVLCEKDIYEVAYGTNPDISHNNNIWRVDHKDSTRFTAYCIDANWKTGGQYAAGSGVPHGYYNRYMTNNKLIPAVVKRTDEYKFNREYVDSYTGLLNIPNSKVEGCDYYHPDDKKDYILGDEEGSLANVLTCLLYYAPQVYGNDYSKTQKAVWYLTNYYGSSEHAADFDISDWEEKGYTLKNIKGNVTLEEYASIEGVQNLVSLRYINIQKTDEDGKPLSGAILSLYKDSYDKSDKDKNLVHTWISDEKTPYSFTLDTNTRYVIHEEKAPNGYKTGEDITFTVNSVGNPIVGGKEVPTDSTGIRLIKVKNEYAGKTVVISKQGITSSKEIPGAKLEITGTTSKGEIEPIKWTSTSEPKEVVLDIGRYTLTEKTAPKGYDIAESINFEIKKDGEFYKVFIGTADQKGQITMKDKASLYDVKIEKKDVNLNPLAGAELLVKSRSTIDESSFEEQFKSTNSPTAFKLPAGEYVLSELKAPINYDKAADIIFTVTKDGRVKIEGNEMENNTVVMIDGLKKFKVSFNKMTKDLKFIEGAKLFITGKAVDGTDPKIHYVSGATTHEEELKPGEYTFIEEEAPVGYSTASPISFKVSSSGTVTLGDIAAEKNTVVMYDELKTYSVKISKTNKEGKLLEGASLSLTGKTIDNSDVNLSWDSKTTATTHSLLPGSYTIEEVSAPSGYEKADNINFTIDLTGKIVSDEKEVKEIVVIDELKTHEIKINKYDSSYTPLEGAILFISGKALDGTSIVNEPWKTDKKTHKEKLKPGEYTLSEKEAPLGYKVADNIDFTISMKGELIIDDEVEKTAALTMIDEKISQYPVSIVKQSEDGLGLADASLTISGKTESGKTIDNISFGSTTGAYTATLYPGEYTLTETAAPKGYVIANPINFKVSSNGSLTVNGNGASRVVMIDAKEKAESKSSSSSSSTPTTPAVAAPNTLTVIKQNVTGQMIAGASLQICPMSNGAATNGSTVSYTINSSTGQVVNTTSGNTNPGNENGTKVRGTAAAATSAPTEATANYSTPVATWLSAANTPYTTTLAPGNYVLHEALAPAGYNLAQDIPFSINQNGKLVYNGTEIANNTLVMVDGITAGQTIDYIKTGYDPLWFKLLSLFFLLLPVFSCSIFFFKEKSKNK